MALRRTLTRRFFSNIAKLSPRPLRPPLSASPLDDSSLTRRPGHHESWSAPPPRPEQLSLPVGEKLIDRIRATNPTRIRLDGLLPLLQSRTSPPGGITLAEARKVARAAEIESVRARLRATGRSCVSYTEFAEICRSASSSGTDDNGAGISRLLDNSGAVIILGDVVFLRPELVAKAIEGMIPATLSPEGERRRAEELRVMEEKKSVIDKRAEASVRRELWLGLGFLAIQTAGFMRLTFWELSWDVMEPICFYVTSVYFMAGYAFFLRTSRDPSFEGFFASRFSTKQRRLMEAHEFDVRRFDELKRQADGVGGDVTFLGQPPHCECHGRNTLLGASH